MSQAEALQRELRSRCDAIEEAYEFMLAFAAQGLTDHRASSTGSAIHGFLSKADAALGDIADVLRQIVQDNPPAALERYLAFVDVLAHDAKAARAAFGVALAQDAISSQLVDNLNASIHVRALLTDIFLIDEALKAKAAPAST